MSPEIPGFPLTRQTNARGIPTAPKEAKFRQAGPRNRGFAAIACRPRKADNVRPLPSDESPGLASAKFPGAFSHEGRLRRHHCTLAPAHLHRPGNCRFLKDTRKGHANAQNRGQVAGATPVTLPDKPRALIPPHRCRPRDGPCHDRLLLACRERAVALLAPRRRHVHGSAKLRPDTRGNQKSGTFSPRPRGGTSALRPRRSQHAHRPCALLAAVGSITYYWAFGTYWGACHEQALPRIFFNALCPFFLLAGTWAMHSLKARGAVPISLSGSVASRSAASRMKNGDHKATTSFS